MAEVLVLVELNPAGGGVRKTTLEALTAARALGEPSAVVIGAPGTAAGVQGRARRVRRGEGLRRRVPRGRRATSSPPRPRCWRSWWREKSPAAVVIPSSPEGKEIAGRLAIKTGSGFLTDVTEIAADGTATQVGVRRRGDRALEGHHRHADLHAARQLGHPRAGRRRRRRGDRRRSRSPTPPRPPRSSTAWSSRRAAARSSPRPRSSSPVAAASPAAENFSDHRGAWPTPSARAVGASPRRGRLRLLPAHASRSGRPARPSRRSSTSPSASPVRSSTAPACRPRRRSWPSTRTPRPRSSSWPTSASSVT